MLWFDRLTAGERHFFFLVRASELEGFGLLDFPRTEQRLIVCLYGGEISSERGEEEDRLRLD